MRVGVFQTRSSLGAFALAYGYLSDALRNSFQDITRHKRQQERQTMNRKMINKTPSLRKIIWAGCRHTNQSFSNTSNFAHRHRNPAHKPNKGEV